MRIQPYHKKPNADSLPICISRCSWWVCSSNLQPKFRLSFGAWSHSVTMVVQAGGLVVGIPRAADWLAWIQFPDLFFGIFGHFSCRENWFSCTNESRQKKVSAYSLPIPISLCAGWVCSSLLEPNYCVLVYTWSLSLTMVVQARGLLVCNLCC